MGSSTRSRAHARRWRDAEHRRREARVRALTPRPARVLHANARRSGSAYERNPRTALAQEAADAARSRRARSRPALHTPVAAQLRHRPRLLSARLVLDEVQPEARGRRRGDARVPPAAPAPAGVADPRRAPAARRIGASA